MKLPPMLPSGEKGRRPIFRICNGVLIQKCFKVGKGEYLPRHRISERGCSYSYHLIRWEPVIGFPPHERAIAGQFRTLREACAAIHTWQEIRDSMSVTRRLRLVKP